MTILDKPPVVSVFGEPEDYTRWEADLTLKDRLFGGVPSNPKLIQGWLRTNMTKDPERVRALVIRTLQERGYAPEDMSWEEVEDTYDELAKTLNQNGFKKDEHGLYIEGRQIMSMLRESVGVMFSSTDWPLYDRGKAKTGKNKGKVKTKRAEGVFRESVHVPDDRIYLGRDEEDGVELKIVHPREQNRESSLSYVEYVEEVTLSVRVEELTGTVPEDGWRSIWQHAERNGLGAMRSQQHGKFFLTRWEAV